LFSLFYLLKLTAPSLGMGVTLNSTLDATVNVNLPMLSDEYAETTIV
jgi:hypothetical protein